MAATWKKPLIVVLFLITRLVLGAVFIYASWDKILNPADFALAVANYQILPKALVNMVALTLPWLEMVCGVSLIIGWISRGSALILAVLLGLFIAALAYSLIRGLDIQCGCFSLTSESAAPLYVDILRDALLLIMALATLVRPRRPAVIAMKGQGA